MLLMTGPNAILLCKKLHGTCMAGKVTVLFDDYITDKMDVYCGKDKKFRNRTSFVRFATERFVEYLERVEEKK